MINLHPLTWQGAAMRDVPRRVPRRRVTFRAAVAVGWVLSCVLTRPACGQGLPMLPDPVSTADLMRFADLLELSTEQQLSLEPLHDAYLERFRRLRDRAIRTFQDDMLDVGLRFAGNRFQIPPREEIESLISQYEDLLERITTVDRTLFSAIEPLLTEDQLLRLPRVRHRRELQVYQMLASEMGGEFNPGAGIDLTRLVEGLDLAPADRVEADSILTGYESARLSRVKALDEVIRDAAVVALDTIDDLGIRGMSREQIIELVANQETIESLKATFDEASKPFQAAAFELSQLNMRTFRRLDAALDDDAAADLRDRFYRRAFRRAYRGPGDWPREYEKALALDGLPEDLSEQIRLEADRYRRQDQQLVDAAVAALESSREYRNFSRLSGEETDPLEARIEQSRERRRELEESALATLEALLGPSLAARLDEPAAAESTPAGATGQVQVSSGGGSTASSSAVLIVTADESAQEDESDLPAPVAVEDLQLYAARLGWSDSDRLVLESLFDDYRRSYDEERNAAADATTEVPEDEAGQTGTPEADPLERLRQLDEAFFLDLAVLASDETQLSGIERLRQMRRRAVASRLAAESGESRGDGESVVDLANLLIRSDLPREDILRLDSLLAAYDDRVTPLFVKRVELVRQSARRRAMWRAAGESGGREAQQLVGAMYRKWREAVAELRAAEHEIVEASRRSLGEALGLLPAGAAAEIRFTYQQAAYPDEFADSVAMERVFDGALGLADVSGRQRERLVEISGDFRSSYLALSEDIVERRRLRDFDRDREGMPRRETIEREIEIERLRFARREVCDRARLRLQLSLTEAQRKLLPDLSRPGRP
jgi:hypothetical protein